MCSKNLHGMNLSLPRFVTLKFIPRYYYLNNIKVDIKDILDLALTASSVDKIVFHMKCG